VGADSNWGTTFRRGLENWGEGLALCQTVVEASFQNGQAKKPNKTNKKKQKERKKTFIFVQQQILLHSFVNWPKKCVCVGGGPLYQ